MYYIGKLKIGVYRIVLYTLENHMYSNSAVIAGWLQSKKGLNDISVYFLEFMLTLACLGEKQIINTLM